MPLFARPGMCFFHSDTLNLSKNKIVKWTPSSVQNRRTDEGVHPTNHDVVLGQVLTSRNGTRCMSARPSLVIASRNVKKRREIEELLAPHGIEVLSVTDFPDVPDVVE